MAQSFTSQSANFLSACSGAVDPRTGMYGYNFAIARLTGNTGLGPDFSAALSYSPLTSDNAGFGTGISLAVSRYDKSTRTLLLSTGERYQVSEAGGVLNIIHAKPINFRTEIRDDGYYIFYKNGSVEKLTAPSTGGNIKVTEAILSPAGRMLTFRWELFGNGKRLLAISDESSVLLNLRYTAADVTINVWPDTHEAHTVELKIQNDLLVSVTNRSVSPVLSWTLAYSNKRLTSVTSPTGLKDRVTYSQAGHRFPAGGPGTALPYVTDYRQTGKDGQLISNLRYQFSDKNFLGYGGSHQTSWNSNTDFMFGVLDDYEYTSTETAVDRQGTALNKTVRTYSNYHLQTKEQSAMVGTLCRSETETIWYALKGKNFDDQPAQYQLPRQQTVTLTDGSQPQGAQVRTHITLTEFDTQGNPLREEKPDGTITEYQYYPAQGDGDNCPPEPHGFVRFIKKQTVTPRQTQYEDTLPEVTEYTYARLSDTDCVVQQSIKKYAGPLLLSERITDYHGDSSSAEFGRIRAITDTLYDGSETFTSRQTFTTVVSDGTLAQTATLIGHDGAVTTSSRVQSALSGLLLSETDARGVTMKYGYDVLGRPLSQTVAAGTDYARTSRWEYAIEDSGPVTIEIDASGNRLKTRFDSAGRETAIQQLDAETTQEFYGIALKTYDMLGRPLTAESRDWLTTGENPVSFGMQATISHDGWGAPEVNILSDDTRTHRKVNPIALTRTTFMQGGGSKSGQISGRQTTTLGSRSMLPLTDTRANRAGEIKGERRYDWDGMGRLRRETDERENITMRTYDVYGRVLTQTLPDGSTLSKTYAPHLTGEQVATISVTGPDASGHTRTWLLGSQTFDSLGRVTKLISGGRTTIYQYEGASLLPSTIAQPSGKTQAYTYIPELNNAISSMTADGVTQLFSYDGNTANLLTAQEGETKNDQAWAPSGSLKNERFTRRGAVRSAAWTHSLTGQVISYTDIMGKQTVYDRDEYGRVTTIDDDALSVTLEYDALGRLQRQAVRDKAAGSTLTTSLAYDDFGREITRTVDDSNGVTLSVSQSWLDNDLLAKRTLRRNNATESEEQYDYDVRHRLVAFSISGSSLPPDAYGHKMTAQTYQYDALNNLTAVNTMLADGSSDTATYHYENADDPTQLTSLTHTHDHYPQSLTLKYDADGRMIRDEAGRTLSYDAIGRLIGVSGENINGGQYEYDALNHLVSQNVSDTDSRQLYYRGAERVNEVLSRQNRETRLIKRGHACLGVTQDNGLTLTAGDRHDSLLWSKNSSHDKGKLHVWSPYGQGQPEDLLPGFNGERADPVSGTYHLGNGYRAYNPVLMRFNCPDSLSPFGAGGINPYAYCAGDPVNHTDPSGHISWQGILGIIAGVAGLGFTIFTAGSSIAAAGGIAAAFNATSGTALVAGTAGLVADITGIASGSIESSNPTTSATLGWVSMASGLAGMATSIAVGLTGSARRSPRASNASASPSFKSYGSNASFYRHHYHASAPHTDYYKYWARRGYKANDIPSPFMESEETFAKFRNDQRFHRAKQPSSSGSSSRRSSGASDYWEEFGEIPGNFNASIEDAFREFLLPRSSVSGYADVAAQPAEAVMNRLIKYQENIISVFPDGLSRREYRSLSRMIHPDKSSVEGSEQATQILNDWFKKL
ncbi:RHS repeat-associated core domain-containing protein [Erwinia tasmaniensis]|nr:RHS repeat-associated core domain-containing protein [Erwinia tasmaniensis]